MVRLTSFNTTTYYTAMSKNTGLENLEGDLAAMPEALESVETSHDNQAIILARLVRGLSPDNWKQVCEHYSLHNWHAFPVHFDYETGDNLAGLDTDQTGNFSVSPFREVRGALTRGMFLGLLKRELLRISRNGGCLSLVIASLADRRRLITALGEGAIKRLDAILGATLLAQMDECDSLGLLWEGKYICCLPGVGQLATRRFAETAQSSFVDAARPFFPSGGISAGNGANCAIGIVNTLQGEHCTVNDLLKRVKTTLDVALSKDEGYIHQETALAPFDGTTLVQSSEKRFLFFGGDSQ